MAHSTKTEEEDTVEVKPEKKPEVKPEKKPEEELPDIEIEITEEYVERKNE